MNKLKLTTKFIDWCNKNGQDPLVIYLLQCSYLISEDCVNVLLESLKSKEYDLIDRVLLRDEYEMKPGTVFFWEEYDSTEVKETKVENKKDWKVLTKLLGKLSIECNTRFGYFFSPKGELNNAKHLWEMSDYDLDKTIKVVTKYYETWSSDINPKGFYSLLLSPDFQINYDNFKESTESFWE